MQNAHVQALQEKHAGLDREIHDEENRPAPDTGLLARLKRQKLRIKEEMQTH